MFGLSWGILSYNHDLLGLSMIVSGKVLRKRLEKSRLLPKVNFLKPKCLKMSCFLN